MERIRRRLVVTGTVQGVGFRPFVFGLARRFGLSGFVFNHPEGVTIEVEGRPDSMSDFERALTSEPPPLAVITSIRSERIALREEHSFEIRASQTRGVRHAEVAADAATCAACLAEVFDPRDRRYRYPFTNCTDCGPRFTIVERIPYDRVNTTMRRFEMCPDCAREYSDPHGRRFHAQPIACPSCGPQLDLISEDDTGTDTDPLLGTVRLLRQGAIVAIKGLGGFHLACDARDAEVVARLRRRKEREEKPLAVMVRDLDATSEIAVASEHERAMLVSVRAPITLLRKAEDCPLAEEVAPGDAHVGVMLPYTPLHHLLMADFGRPLVLTSGNRSDEPIAFQNRDAFERLAGIADAFLVHDRPIRTRCDDSVVRVMAGAEYPIRRSRGFAPSQIKMTRPFSSPILAAGPELKHTFCLAAGDTAIVSHHIGDLHDHGAFSAFVDGVAHLEALFEITPEAIAHDLHPEYLATRWALAQEGVQHVAVQHHHAHIASCLADNARDEEVIGLAFDGTGMGDDGTIWGCEVMTADLGSYQRLMHLSLIPLPGGEAAVREPWRMGAVYLEAAYGQEASSLDIPFVRDTAERWGPLFSMVQRKINSPLASSAGRLFDAAAAICGIRMRNTYEGQAAAELERVADISDADPYPCPVVDGRIDGIALIRALADDLVAGRPVPEAAAAFHLGLAAASVAACVEVRDRTGLEVVALSGGTWQNLLLLEAVREGLAVRGFEILVHRQVPCNDGGISLGQAAVAGARTWAGA